MDSDVVKIYATHKRSWFPNPTHGTRDQCSAHGVVDQQNCRVAVTNDVLLREPGGAYARWAVCKKWLEEEPKAIAYLNEHGYDHHDPD